MKKTKINHVVLVVTGIVITSFVLAEIRNGFEIGKAKSFPNPTGNILYVGGTGLQVDLNGVKYFFEYELYIPCG